VFVVTAERINLVYIGCAEVSCMAALKLTGDGIMYDVRRRDFHR